METKGPALAFIAIISVLIVTLIISTKTGSDLPRPKKELLFEEMSDSRGSLEYVDLGAINDIKITGEYTAYDEKKLSFAKSGKVVIFFATEWCETCHLLEADIRANPAIFPTDLMILKADFDKNTNLKEKYDVTAVHTLVQVNENGEVVKKWIGSTNVSEVVNEVL